MEAKVAEKGKQLIACQKRLHALENQGKDSTPATNVSDELHLIEEGDHEKPKPRRPRPRTAPRLSLSSHKARGTDLSPDLGNARAHLHDDRETEDTSSKKPRGSGDKTIQDILEHSTPGITSSNTRESECAELAERSRSPDTTPDTWKQSQEGDITSESSMSLAFSGELGLTTEQSPPNVSNGLDEETLPEDSKWSDHHLEGTAENTPIQEVPDERYPEHSLLPGYHYVDDVGVLRSTDFQTKSARGYRSRSTNDEDHGEDMGKMSGREPEQESESDACGCLGYREKIKEANNVEQHSSACKCDKEILTARSPRMGNDNVLISTSLGQESSSHCESNQDRNIHSSISLGNETTIKETASRRKTTGMPHFNLPVLHRRSPKPSYTLHSLQYEGTHMDEDDALVTGRTGRAGAKLARSVMESPIQRTSYRTDVLGKADILRIEDEREDGSTMTSAFYDSLEPCAVDATTSANSHQQLEEHVPYTIRSTRSPRSNQDLHHACEMQAANDSNQFDVTHFHEHACVNATSDTDDTDRAKRQKQPEITSPSTARIFKARQSESYFLTIGDISPTGVLPSDMAVLTTKRQKRDKPSRIPVLGQSLPNAGNSDLVRYHHER